MTPNEILVDVQEQIFNSSGTRTDIYYEEGRGAIIVHEGHPLMLHNVMLNIPEYVIRMGNKININFN